MLFKGKVVPVWQRGYFKVLGLKEGDITVAVISGIFRQELIDMITSLGEFEPVEESREGRG